MGLSTLFATLVLDKEKLEKLPDFYQRLKWFRQYRMDNQEDHVIEEFAEGHDLLLSLVPEHRLRRLLVALLDEQEFLGQGGIRAISKRHETPAMVEVDGQSFGLQYEPGESTTGLFGGNSNWRGPIWMPMNYLLIQSLKTYHSYYQDRLKVAYPTGADQEMNLAQIAQALSRRLASIFQRDDNGKRPVHGRYNEFHFDPHYRDLILFYEYFHGDTARGVGASHQTGWTGLIAELIESLRESDTPTPSL
ncbi:MAG: hypothetical protein SF053_08560 [Bacteroidia bacterium]|nr:hypothetical protein [Bacteroidia bacterium]